MSSKRRLRRKQCSRKRRLTKRAAILTAVRLRATSAVAVDAYRCPFDSSHWHVGHRPKKIQFAVSARRRERERNQ